VIPGTASAIAGSTQTTPVNRGSVQVSTQNSGSTFSPTMPAHQAGDVLLVFAHVELDNSPSNLSATGWTKKAEVQDTGAQRDLALFVKTATNSSTTISISNPNNKHAIAHVYALQFASGTVSAQTAQNQDPPSLTASWGYGANLWFAACISANTPGVIPTGFGDEVQTTISVAGTLTTCDKADQTNTLDPSEFTGGQSATLTAVVQAA
jgi:hypothetical protein